MTRTDKLITYWCKLIDIKLDKNAIWTERNNHYHLIERVEYLITLSYFLSLREKIKKEIQSNYHNLDYIPIFVEYDEYGFFEIDCVNSHKLILQPLIEEYINKVKKEIENNNLTLEL